jgi:hypothetical protein
MQGSVLEKQVLYRLNHTSSPFWFWLFWRWGPHELCAWVGFKLLILQISVSQVARIIGMSLWHPADTQILQEKKLQIYITTF